MALFKDLPISKALANQKRLSDLTLQETSELRNQFYQQLQDYKLSFVQDFHPLFKTFNSDFLKDITKPIRDSFEQFSKDLREAIKHTLQLLGKEGWFLDPELPVFPLSFRGHPHEMTEWLCGFYRKKIDEIERKLANSYPHRARLLRQAFEAHREGKYGLSIPVFLAQADGIFWDRTPGNQNLFIGYQRSGAYDQYASQISGNFDLALLYPISIPLPLWRNWNERSETEEFRVCLNRHQVLHGESTDYDTEQNSLKAISLLSYLHWIFSGVTDGPNG